MLLSSIRSKIPISQNLVLKWPLGERCARSAAPRHNFSSSLCCHLEHFTTSSPPFCIFLFRNNWRQEISEIITISLFQNPWYNQKNFPDSKNLVIFSCFPTIFPIKIKLLAYWINNFQKHIWYILRTIWQFFSTNLRLTATLKQEILLGKIILQFFISFKWFKTFKNKT